MLYVRVKDVHSEAVSDFQLFRHDPKVVKKVRLDFSQETGPFVLSDTELLTQYAPSTIIGTLKK